MIVVDTNVVSELMRPAPAPAVLDWVADQAGRRVYTTAITLAEIRYGIERVPDGARKEVLRTAADEVFTAFAAHVLPFDAGAAIEYSVLVCERERAGLPISGFDAQIASICRARRYSLATRNLQDFRVTGIHLIDPWRAAGEPT